MAFHSSLWVLVKKNSGGQLEAVAKVASGEEVMVLGLREQLRGWHGASPQSEVDTVGWVNGGK